MAASTPLRHAGRKLRHNLRCRKRAQRHIPCTEAQRKISMRKRRMKMWNAKWPWKTRDTCNTSMLGFQEAETKQNHALHVKHVIHGVCLCNDVMNSPMFLFPSNRIHAIQAKHGHHDRICGRTGHVKQNSHTRRRSIFTSKVTTIGTTSPVHPECCRTCPPWWQLCQHRGWTFQIAAAETRMA